MNQVNRRTVIRAGLAASPLISVGSSSLPLFLSRSAAAAEITKKNEKILVVIQLLGGNDGLNTVVPHKIDGYSRGRRALRLNAGSLVSMNDEIGLHSAMKPLQSVLDSGRLAVIQGVGYPNPDRSHFRSMDIWESASLNPDQIQTGWLGRAMDRSTEESPVAKISGVHIGSRTLPLALRAKRSEVPSLERLDQLQLRGDNTLTRMAADLDRMSKLDQSSQFTKGPDSDTVPDNPLLGFVARTTATAVASSKKLADLQSAQGSVKYPETSLGQRLQLISRMILADLDTRVYYTSLDGFDTHANQLNVHAGLLEQVASSVSAFETDLNQAGLSDRVAILVFSEFGRRLAENASLGTDHGAAAPVFLIGPLVRNGLIGDHPSMDPKDLNDGDIKFHTDFRCVYADILASHLAIDPTVILGQGFDPLGVLKMS